jgi:ribosome-associated protein
MPKLKEYTSDKLVETIINAMQDKKAEDIVSLDLRKTGSSVADVFIICHGNSTTQVDAIASFVEDETRKKLKEKPWKREGIQNAQWAILDYVNVVVHVFLNETREFYKLEELWGDAIVSKHEYQL